MSTPLRDLMQLYEPTLVDPVFGGEEMVYGYRAGGPTRTVRGVVDRQGRQPAASGVRTGVRGRAVVWIPRHPECGVLSVSPGDTVQLALRIGDPVVVARISEVLDEDEGGFTLEVHA